MRDYFSYLFDTSGFQRRDIGDGWTPGLSNLHIVCDILAAAAFLAVFVVLAYQLLRPENRNVPKRIWLPVLLLLIAALMHVMEVWQFWWPAYRFAALLKLMAALVSWATLLSFIPF